MTRIAAALASLPDSEIKGSPAMTWLKEMVSAQLDLITNFVIQPCHGKKGDNFENRYKRRENPSLNDFHGGHKPVEIHKDHCDLNDDMLGWLFEISLSDFRRNQWRKRMNPVVALGCDSTPWQIQECTNRYAWHCLFF